MGDSRSSRWLAHVNALLNTVGMHVAPQEERRRSRSDAELRRTRDGDERRWRANCQLTAAYPTGVAPKSLNERKG
jgi:hypothetical protein